MNFKAKIKKLDFVKIAVGLTIIAVLGLVLFSIILLCRKSYDLSDFVRIETVGYDGAGSINLTVNTDSFLENAHNKGELGEIEEIIISPKIENNGKLSNENKALISFSNNQNLVFDTIEYEITSLDKPTTLEVFENVQVSFFGANSNGTATIDTSKCSGIVQSSINYNISQQKNLTNGDVITVTATAKDNLLSKGYTIASKQKNYTVKGLIVYPENLDGIDCNESNTYLHQQTLTRLQEGSLAYNWNYDRALTSDWYLVGSFDFEYITEPVAIYYCYDDTVQDNFYSIIYKAKLRAKCNGVSSAKVDKVQNSIKQNKLSKGDIITGEMYCITTVNGVYLDKTESNLVIPDTDKNYSSDLLGRSYVDFQQGSSLHQLEKSITDNHKTIICIKKK